MKTIKAEKFFTTEEKERIRHAVESAEAATSGEIVTMVVDHSDRYLEAEVLGGILLSGLVALVVSISAHYAAVLSHIPLDMTLWSYVPLVFLLYFPARSLFVRFPYLKLPFINRNRVMHAVRERAVRAFFEKRLYKTRDENGVLFIISLLERKVWVIGDRGIDLKISHVTWNALARDISTGIGEGRACEALCKAIEQCGAKLAEHFPKKADDTNELPDEMIL